METVQPNERYNLPKLCNQFALCSMVFLEFASLYGICANLNVYRKRQINCLQSGVVQHSNSLQTICKLLNLNHAQNEISAIYIEVHQCELTANPFFYYGLCGFWYGHKLGTILVQIFLKTGKEQYMLMEKKLIYVYLIDKVAIQSFETTEYLLINVPLAELKLSDQGSFLAFFANESVSLKIHSKEDIIFLPQVQKSLFDTCLITTFLLLWQLVQWLQTIKPRHRITKSFFHFSK